MGESAVLDDSPEGFAIFYHLLFDRPLPRHALDDWVRPLYAARGQGRGLIVEAFRGSSKTTTLSIAFAAFRPGMEPHKSVLVIQASNQAAQTTCQQIADLIQHNPGWPQAFPDVVADKEKNWSLRGGYEIKRAAMDYDEWRGLCQREKGRDPNLIGVGYRSQSLVGRHPTGLLLVDDIHDETNTRSQRELDKVIAILTGTILPTVTPKAWQIFVGTPWTRNDALHQLKATEQYCAVATPIYLAGADDGVPTPGEVQRMPAWPERYPLEQIDKIRQTVGESQFARMYLLDLPAAEGIHLKAEWLLPYPHAGVQPGWPVVMGVDYASTVDKQKDSRRDYFAVAIGRAIPGGGGIILVDGFRAHLSQAEAEQKLLELVSFYPTTQMIGVEAVGKGEEFYQLLSRNPALPTVPMQPGGSTKGERFQNAMAPIFERGWARVVDVSSPFLYTFRDEWLRWPTAEHDDTLDAVYWMLRVGQAYLAKREKAKVQSPFLLLARK